MNSFTFAIFFLHYVSSGYVSQWASGQSEIQALTMSPSGKVLYTSGADGSIKVWSHPDGRLIETVPLKSHNIGIISILEATDSYLYAVGQGSNNIIVLTLTNITRVSQMIGSGGMISNVRLYNKDLFSSSGDGTIIQWSLSDKGILNKYTLPQNYGVIMSISFSTNFIFAILDSDVIIRFTIGQPNAMISSPVLGATSGRLQPLLVSNEQYVFYSLSDWSLVQVSTKDLSVIRSFTPHWGPLSALAISENLLFTSSQNDFIVKQWLIADDMSYGGPLSPNDDLFWSVRLFLVHDNYLYFCSERIDLIQQCIFSDKPSEYTEKPSSTIRPVGTLTSFGQTLSPTNLESEIEWTSLTEHIPADKRIFLKENSYMGSFLSHTEKGFAFGFWAGSGSVPRSQCSVPSFTYISMPSFEEKTWNISGYHYDSFVVQEKFFPRILSKYASVIVTDNNNNNWYVIHGGGFCNETVLRASLESPYRMFATNIDSEMLEWKYVREVGLVSGIPESNNYYRGHSFAKKDIFVYSLVGMYVWYFKTPDLFTNQMTVYWVPLTKAVFPYQKLFDYGIAVTKSGKLIIHGGYQYELRDTYDFGFYPEQRTVFEYDDLFVLDVAPGAKQNLTRVNGLKGIAFGNTRLINIYGEKIALFNKYLPGTSIILDFSSMTFFYAKPAKNITQNMLRTGFSINQINYTHYVMYGGYHTDRSEQNKDLGNDHIFYMAHFKGGLESEIDIHFDSVSQILGFLFFFTIILSLGCYCGPKIFEKLKLKRILSSGRYKQVA